MTDKKLFACDDCAISKALSCLIEDQGLSEWTTARFKTSGWKITWIKH